MTFPAPRVVNDSKNIHSAADIFKRAFNWGLPVLYKQPQKTGTRYLWDSIGSDDYNAGDLKQARLEQMS